jgi:hypothetical protein
VSLKRLLTKIKFEKIIQALWKELGRKTTRLGHDGDAG